MSALGIGLAAWFTFAVAIGIPIGLLLKRLRRAHPLVRTAANDDFIRSAPPFRRRRARRGG